MIFSMYYMVVKNIAHYVSLDDRQDDIIDKKMPFTDIFSADLAKFFPLTTRFCGIYPK